MNMNMNNEKEVSKFCKRMLDRHLSESICMFDYADSKPVDDTRYYTTDEYVTPLRVRNQWALSWAILGHFHSVSII